MPFEVTIVESERGWGQKIDAIEYFQKEENAVRRVDEINGANTKEVVPDIYWFAEEPRFVRSIPANKKFKD